MREARLCSAMPPCRWAYAYCAVHNYGLPPEISAMVTSDGGAVAACIDAGGGADVNVWLELPDGFPIQPPRITVDSADDGARRAAAEAAAEITAARNWSPAAGISPTLVMMLAGVAWRCAANHAETESRSPLASPRSPLSPPPLSPPCGS